MWTLLAWIIGPATAIFLFFANWGDDLPEAVQVASVSYTDTPYAHDKDRLDIYLTQPLETSARAQTLTPVLFFIHGGGLLIGDKTDQTQLGHKFASQGYTTVLTNHRLSPGVSHPSHIQDIASAFAWVRQNIADYGGDPNRIFVAGHSSGGYLAMLLASDTQYLAQYDLTLDNIRGVIPVSGFFYIERLAPGRPKSVWGEDINAWPEASPANYISADTPATLLLYAENDNDARKLESLDLAAKLEALGNKQVAIHEIADRNHATIGLYMMTNEDKTSDYLLAFMKQHL